MNKSYKITTSIGLILLLLTTLCRYSKTMADAYATKVYPTLSCVLSWLSSFTSYNIYEFAITAIIIAALSIIVMGIKRRWGFARCLRYEATLVLWTYLWFYVGWGTNYSRSNLYERTRTEYAGYDEAKFIDFVQQFIDESNKAYVPIPLDAKNIDNIYDLYALEQEIKTFYASVPAHYGLASPHRWQHPKRIVTNAYFSSVGVSGFMAPYFSESCLNADILPFDYPMIYAHEYAHLLGVSEEAEANWWAFYACSHSKNPKVRYSAYKYIMQHVLYNVNNLLDEQQNRTLQASLRPEVIKDIQNTQDYWEALRSPALDEIQGRIYDLFLKSNNVRSGLQNYTQVVGLLINIKYYDSTFASSSSSTSEASRARAEGFEVSGF